MRLWQFTAGALTLGTTLSLLTLTGCGSKDTKPPEAGGGQTTSGTDGTPKAKKTALMAGKGVVMGKVTLDGPAPNIKEMDEKFTEFIKKEGKADVGHCLSPDAPEADKTDPKWRIKENAVANVAVFLVPEGSTFFACSDKDPGVQKVKDEPAKLKQPYCAFEPHVQFVFPQYVNDKGKKEQTGQKFEVINNSKMTKDKKGIGHNTKWSGGLDLNGLKAEGNKTFGPDDPPLTIGLAPSNTPVSFQCSVHPWMSAFVWVRDNPYFAVTDAEGNFKIENVPTGKVGIVAWHEAAKFINKAGIKGDPIEVKEGTPVTKDFTVKAQ